MRRAAFQPTREQLAPRGAIKITDRTTGAEVFIYESGGAPCALVFSGRRNKPDLHVKYKTPERRDDYDSRMRHRGRPCPACRRRHGLRPRCR